MIRPPCPTEKADHLALIRWVNWMEERIPDLKYFIHYPASGFNIGAVEKAIGSKAVIIQRKRLKALGVRPDVSDFFWPVRRGQFSGLWLELKRERGGKKVGSGQNSWLEAMRINGYCAAVAFGYDEAVGIITQYNSLKEV